MIRSSLPTSLLSSHIPALSSFLHAPDSLLAPNLHHPSLLTPYTQCWRNKYGHVSTPSSASIVLRPSSPSEISKILAYANTHSLKIIPQGGNTSLVGGATPPSPQSANLILSLSRLSKIHAINTSSNYIHCQSGVLLHNLQTAAATAEPPAHFPLSLGSSGSCQIGGNVSTNAGGEFFSRYGSITSNLLGLTAILPTGETLDLHNTNPKNSAGFSLANLFVGSEGTLGVITDVCMKLHPFPHKATALLTLPRENAVDAAAAIAALASVDVAAIEFMDGLVLSLSPSPLPIDVNAADDYLLIETHGTTPEAAEHSLSSFLVACESALPNAPLDGIMASSSSSMNEIWSIRESCGPTVNTFKHKYKYDLCLPLHLWEDLKTLVQRRVQPSGGTVVTWGHLSDRNVHLNVVWDDTATIGSNEMSALLDPFVYEFVIRQGGSISAEHGIGIEKKRWMPSIKTGEEIAMMKAIKKQFDPNNIMNPDKLL